MATENTTLDLLSQKLTAFDGYHFIAAGYGGEVIATIKDYVDRNPMHSLLVFNDSTGGVVEIELRGDRESVVQLFLHRAKLAQPTDNLIASLRSEPGPGRPKLGVVAREVTLLPRHWEWLNRQPGGASVALRKLVEEARKSCTGKERVREAQERTYQFLSAIAGDLPGYEEALRALFATNQKMFEEIVGLWPAELADYTKQIALDTFSVESDLHP